MPSRPTPASSRPLLAEVLRAGAGLALIATLGCTPSGARPVLGPPTTSAGPTADPVVDAFVAGLDVDRRGTYTATYVVVRNESAPDQVVVTQAEGAVVVRSEVRVVFDDADATSCELATGTCVDGVHDQPLTGLEWDFATSGTAREVTDAVGRAPTPATAEIRSVVGREAECVVIPTSTGAADRWCRTLDGVLALAEFGTLRVELADLADTVDPAAFDLPE